MAATSSVLLIGEAQVPGNLVLTATDSAGAFGDVPIGTTISRAIVMTNPGQIPSARVTIGGMTAHSRPLSLRVEAFLRAFRTVFSSTSSAEPIARRLIPSRRSLPASAAIRWNPNASRVNTANSNSSSPTVRIGRNRVHQL